MRRRSRFQRFSKWAGVCASALIVLLWVGSLIWSGWYWQGGNTWGCEAECEWGNLFLHVIHARERIQWPGAGTSFYIISHARWREMISEQVGHDVPPDRHHYGFVLPELVTRSSPDPRTLFFVRVPLWLLLLLLLVSTGILFWRDRRRRIPPGHCQKCGYNLTGNVSGVCPECGRSIVGAVRAEKRAEKTGAKTENPRAPDRGPGLMS